jgi:N-acyl-D-amino-acid deacylase
MFDLVFRDGYIVDGTSNPWYRGDVAVKDGLIAQVGNVRNESRTDINVSGLVISPGFIDTHSHSDLYLIHEPASLMKLMQGITTEIIAQDGLSEAPIRSDVVDEWRRYLSGLNGDPPIDWCWRSLEEYLNTIESSMPGVNVASLVGHGNLRLLAIGMEDREPTPGELDQMKKLLIKSLQGGAIGLSTGLIYAPCVYSRTSELVELCKVVSNSDGVFVVHMRDEGDRLLESIEEVLFIGMESGVHVHISHFKASGKANWGKSKDAIAMLEDAHRSGVRVSYDQYPYTAGSTFLSSLLPSWVHEGGVDHLLSRLKDPSTRESIRGEYASMVDIGRVAGWNRVMVTYVGSDSNKVYEGLYLSEIAERRGVEPIDVLLDLVLEEENRASMANFTMSPEDVDFIMMHHLGMTCTDGLLLGKPHPRAYGAFPRVLGHYVRENKTLRLEEAVRRMTSYPSRVFHLGDRGFLLPGYVADIVVFDPDRIIDTSTFSDPRRFPEGIRYVVVSGEVSVRDGVYTGVRNGRVIRSN